MNYTFKLTEAFFWSIFFSFVYHHCVANAIAIEEMKKNDITTNSQLLEYIIHKLQSSSSSKQKECEIQLKLETNRTWSCDIEYKHSNETRTPVFCFCSLSYQCQQEESIYMSQKYAMNTRRKNKANHIERGADYQCELILNKPYSHNRQHQPWTCGLYQKSTNNDAEIYCKCTQQRTCLRERIVDFY